MEDLKKQDDNIVQNTIHLISRYLDRYEGKKILKPELKIS